MLLATKSLIYTQLLFSKVFGFINQLLTSSQLQADEIKTNRNSKVSLFFKVC